MNNILEVDSVILNFGDKRVLSNIYLKCSTGEAVGILGRNGSGKTTLLRIIFGELETNNKSVRINGQVFSEPYKSKELIKFLPQFNFLLPTISIKQLFKSFKIDFNDFVTLFPGFEKYYKLRLTKLSGGERRIVEIYTILACKSLFCLLDEPFTHIMPIHIETFKQLIEREKLKKGIILIDHLYKNVIDICTRIYIIENGKTNPVLSDSDFQRFGYLS
ncbi:MAG: ATP-binding cassette domain-containing protein [Bacteroidetes bacterium]|nr:MAG: ATP-binding cassette domain-containing protein [Bacteroidota bacterium]